MAKKFKREEVGELMRADLHKKYGPKLVEAAKQLGKSPQALNCELSRVPPEKRPTWLMRLTGYKFVTYVVRADK